MEPTIVDRGRGPEIAGTRITVYDVWDYLKLGWHHSEIAAVLRLSSDQVRVASQYIEAHRDAVLANYQSIVDRHRNYRYSPDVEAKIAQCQARFQARKREIEVRRNSIAHADSLGGQ